MFFDFAPPHRIVFGAGRIAEIGRWTTALGRRAMLIVGGHSLERAGRIDTVERSLREAGVEAMRIGVVGEPTVEQVDDVTRRARTHGADVVVAVGGGSVLDAGKAVAALLGSGGEALDYLEGVGRSRAITISAPFVAAPTTAGTGSEATHNAVLSDAAGTFKKSMRAEAMRPDVALVDPELTRGAPLEVVGASGLDAVTQLLEAFTALKANPMTDTLAREGLAHAAQLPRLAEAATDDARAAMAWASLLGGVCLAHAGLGVVHALASPLGAGFPAPHGVVCARLLPGSIRLNVRQAAERGDAETLARYAEASRLLCGDHSASAADLADWVDDLNDRFGLARLGDCGLAQNDFERVIQGAGASNLKNNPVELTPADLADLLRGAL